MTAVYTVRVLDAAIDDLKKLDRPVARRILERIQWLADNLDSINREALTGSFAGLYKFRVGDYRIIYEVIETEQRLIVHIVGHRRDVYRP